MLMKNLLKVFLVSLFLTSCIVNDNFDVTVDLVGTWRMTSFSTENAYNLNGDGTANTDVIVETGCYQNETIEFIADNTGVSRSTSFLDIETIITVGTTNEVEYNIDCVAEIFNSNFTWSQNGSAVSITDTGVTITGTLIGSTITLVIPEGFSIEGLDNSGNNVLITILEDVTIVYTKQ